MKDIIGNAEKRTDDSSFDVGLEGMFEIYDR